MTQYSASEHFLVVDASVWVSRLVPQDEFHDKVTAFLENQRNDGAQFISPTLLLAEVGGAVSRRTKDPDLAKKAVDQLQNLPGLRLVQMEDDLIQQAAQLAAELSLRGANSVYVAVAHQLHLPLVTLDIEQRERSLPKVAVQTIP